MTNPLRPRRRADRFAQLLDEANGGRRQHIRSPYDDELAELVALRSQLVATPTPRLDSEFQTGLRTMLLAAAEREGIGATAEPAPAPRPARRTVAARAPRARTAMVAGVAVGAVAFAGMSTASGNAVPGDALYGLKRSSERAQLALASSDVGRAQLYLDFAETRLAEAMSLTSGLDQVLADMDRDTVAGVRLLTTAAANRRDPAAIDPVDRFVASQLDRLAELAGQVSGADLSRIGVSLDLLDDIEERAAGLRQDLDLGCPSASDIDVLGPLPSACLTLPAPDTIDDPAPTAPGETGTADQPDTAAPDGGQDDTAAPADEEDPDVTDPVEIPADEDEPSATDDEETPADEEGEQDSEGGLLSTLNRLLGNLLGG